jgi:putative hydrolase of the HAD superfamily
MKKATGISCAFLDIGGVLLTDGWDHLARKRAAKQFKLEWAEMEERHGLTFEIFEEGKITLDEYMSLVVFYLNYAHGHLATPENPVLQQ